MYSIVKNSYLERLLLVF